MCSIPSHSSQAYPYAVPLLLPRISPAFVLMQCVADRRPIDPPPVVQLRVIDKSVSRSSSPDEQCVSQTLFRSKNSMDIASQYSHSFLQNPYYFMYASLASPDRDEELHLLKDGKTRCTTGSVVSSLYHLKDPEAVSESLQLFSIP